MRDFFIFCKVNFFPAKIPFYKKTKESFAEKKIYFANEGLMAQICDGRIGSFAVHNCKILDQEPPKNPNSTTHH
jgi:hypothetical protein